MIQNRARKYNNVQILQTKIQSKIYKEQPETNVGREGTTRAKHAVERKYNVAPIFSWYNTI